MADFRNAIRSVVRAPAWLARAVGARRRLLFGGWAGVLVVLIAVVAVMFGQTQAQAHADAAGREALKSANDKIGKVLGYSYNTIDDDVARAKTMITGKFANDYGGMAEGLIMPTAKRDEITSEIRVISSSVVSAASDKVTTLLFLNQTAKSKTLKEPKVEGSRVRVTLEQVNDQWLISELTPV